MPHRQCHPAPGGMREAFIKEGLIQGGGKFGGWVVRSGNFSSIARGHVQPGAMLLCIDMSKADNMSGLNAHTK